MKTFAQVKKHQTFVYNGFVAIHIGRFKGFNAMYTNGELFYLADHESVEIS